MMMMIINGSFDLGPTTRPYNISKEKGTGKIMDFAVSAYHRVKLKEREKKDIYFDITKELKKL